MTPLAAFIVAAAVSTFVSGAATYAILPHPLTRSERTAVAAQFIVAVSLGISALRDYVPSFVTITVTNTVLTFGFLLRAASFAPEGEHERALRFTAFATVVTAIEFEAFRRFGVSLRWRVVASSVTTLVGGFLELTYVGRLALGLRTRLPRFVVLADSVLMAAHFARIVTVLTREPEGPFLQQLGVQVPVFLGGVGSAIGGGLAFLAIRLEVLQDEAVAAATRAARAEAERDATEREHRETRLAHDETKRLLTERTDLIDLLAHEIRQPLNNASAALEAALEASKPDPAGASARALVRASNVLARVISTLNNTLAAATRLAEDAQAITRQPTDLRDIVELARLSFDESRIDRIAVRVDALTTDAELDASLMQLAVRNLLDNALKFSPPGTRVHLVLDELESGDWRVRVTNVGHLERLSHDVDVFEKRVRGVTGRSVEGAGLGLFIVRRVAELHGGTAFMQEADGQVTVGFSFAGV